MNLPYKLVAIDLDGTLLSADHEVSPRSAAALRNLLQMGVHCILASGRMHSSMLAYAKPLGLSSLLVSCNGAMIRSIESDEIVFHQPVPAHLASEIIGFSEAQSYHLNYYSPDKVFAAERTKWAEFYLSQTNSPMEVVGDLSSLLIDPPTKLILIDSEETTNSLLPDMKARFGDALYITKTNPEYLEFMHPAANKGLALARVANLLGVKREETLAFGDGNNDIPMLEWAGRGVAMQNATTSAREVADDVAPPNYEDGVARYLEALYS